MKILFINHIYDTISADIGSLPIIQRASVTKIAANEVGVGQ